MSSDCGILNPLKRDGTSQAQRLVRALHPSYVSVDEREIQDFLMYARKYAELIRYYSVENNPEGDWKAFIENDVSTVVSMVASTDLEAYKEAFEASTNLVDKFSPILDLTLLADQWYINSVSGLSLRRALEKLIKSILNTSLRNMLGYALRAAEVGAIPVGTATAPNTLSGIWSLDSLQADPLLFPSEDPLNAADQADAIERLSDAFQLFFDGLQAIISQSADFLEETLEEYPQHEAPMALFLAFLHVFKLAQNHLNTITRRHLNFYFRDVLCLEPKPAQADEVHIIFQLAKNFEQYLVKEGTALNAGKDENKADLTFDTDENLLVNKAQIDEEEGLKSVFIEKILLTSEEASDEDKAIFSDISSYVVKNIYAAPVANSSDGLGADIEDEEGKWQTFGGSSMPHAEIGFGVASPIFLMKEGVRTASIVFQFSKQLEYDLFNLEFFGADLNCDVAQEMIQNINVLYTGEEGWVSSKLTEALVWGDDENVFIGFSMVLPVEAEPVVGYKKEVFEEGLNTQHPMFKFTFDNYGLIPKDETNEFVSFRIKEKARPFDIETEYSSNAVVEFNNKWYKFIGTDPSSGTFPSRDPINWFQFKESYLYKYFTPLDLIGFTLNVGVDNMQGLILENDLGTINPSKPFLPFGSIPKSGSSFLIGNQEVFQKNLSSAEALSLIFKWADVPGESFAAHYNEYLDFSITDDNDNAFKVDVEHLNDGTWDTVVSDISLFDSNTNSTTSPKRDNPIDISSLNDKRKLNTQEFSALTPDLKCGFIRLVLKKDFGHKKYPNSITTFIGGNPNSWPHSPNEPYTPTLQSIKLSYNSSESLMFKDISFKGRVEQFFHFGPFGWREFFPSKTGVDPKEAIFTKKLVPEFLAPDPFDKSENPNQVDAEGTLFIGLKDLDPEQTVSILFQVAEGSANPEKKKQDVIWSYLSNNQWIRFESTQILGDATNGLLTSGIITFVMPKAMTSTNTILKQGLYWIKASVAQDTDAISQTIAILPQAVKATFRIEENNDLNRLKNPLPGETIVKLRERQASIKKVLQPFSSFNGKVEEQTEAPKGVTGEDVFKKEYNEFYIRVSERLRHKNRGITIFDYERIVLQQFPDVYKVKCLNHTRIEKRDEDNNVIVEASEHAPGHVKLIVLPNLRNRNAIDPLRPMVSLNRLEEIKAHLTPLICDFTTLEVQNPNFERVKVEFKVKFFPLQEANSGFYKKLLNQEIIQFLSPWLYEKGKDLELGGRVHRSVILNFVEERDYVDFVTDFKLHHIVSDTLILNDVEEAVAASSSSVIVSAEKHDIKNDIIVPC